ncbi:SUKH-3 domain-containing protein [Micromonospora krabiensis]|uniref:SUKH-3 immunity protein n=1 Tax=Micromonospora krabiensis TaxID=307121 RepID=A0A1C3N0Z8_9ACTN|nr:SUKH-3 domain-containing protein [Micromonospora krabiensis]SBV26273.1 SUKH-3 immunity protein [Micromonospora krabiensis]
MPPLSPRLELLLRRAGWFPGRQVDIAPWKESLGDFAWHAAAEEFLREFGGVRVEVNGPGAAVAQESFEIDPGLAVGEEKRFAELSVRYGLSFFPLGEVGQGEFFLAIDQDGVLYYLSVAVFRLGLRELGLDHLVGGIAAERISPPSGDAT